MSESRKRQKDDKILHEANRCMWYDQCHFDQGTNVWYNCFSNSKSKRMKDEQGLKILSELCPRPGFICYYFLKNEKSKSKPKPFEFSNGIY